MCLQAVVFVLAMPLWADKPKDSPAQEIVRLTNEFRKAEKLAELKTSDALMKIAQAHADNMARQDKYGDDDKNGHVLDGKDMKDRIEAAGYKFRMIGENVAMSLGHKDPVSVTMKGWKDSPHHRENMLNKEFTEMGAGVAQGKSGRWYFVQEFGKPRE
ncbi:MAG: CAP domain-containing protein [Gemmataceae bacterium]